ncbi:hypothetical protein CDO52_17395 [Nocardiopsis gilva YIM 90087]|uniref:Uncharacterized protein n=1 Tax=Nocardiopsis gilva YIM 90087 TaxID=1235441 RepID=A0A223S895_9ACTN|nr:hypothetical protein [Nocardiopsis gilva]ASU84337.1 hypothetical protein CDO52_17395 [Nocardiopsis gilva YIM 90087]
MIARRTCNGGQRGEDGRIARPRPPGYYLESAAYWLLYVVSFAAAVMHWRLGNELLAALCVVAVLISACSIARVYWQSRTL